mgnify:CR=1 FL=1
MLFVTIIDRDNASPSNNGAIVSIVGLGDAFTINVDTKFVHFPVRMRSPYGGRSMFVPMLFVVALGDAFAIDVCVDVVRCGIGRRIHHQC